MEYDFRKIEQEWQKKWKETEAYKVSNESTKPSFYVLDMFPYPSGAGLHVGHPLGYIASDIYSRYKRLKGFNVLHPMGFDSFGLPAEQYALETGQHPAVTTEKNIETFKAQLDKIGFCYDWSREVRTSDASYYKWTQKIFLELFNSYFCNTCKQAKPITELIAKYEERGGSTFNAAEWKAFSELEKAEILMKRRLAFSKYGEVNWCEALGTVLANDEVVNGVSERGGHPVEKKKMRQWYLRITAYADRLLQGLDTVDFSDPMKEMQKNWIGKSEGAEMEFVIDDGRKTIDDVAQSVVVDGQSSVVGSTIKVYTTRPDTIFGVDFLVLAPEHLLVAEITTAEQKIAIEEYLTYVKSRSDRERQAEVKQITGCFTGAYAINPFNGKPIPVWIAEYVLAGYGTGAIMAVPCGDQRDFSFAKHFNIPITNIIGSHYNGEEANATKDATLENSDFLNGMLMKDAIAIAINKIEELGIGKRKINYRMRDAGFSRQRYWGEPFPIVWQDGIAISLNENELPLELPHAEKYGPGPNGEGPLANMEEWCLVDLTPTLSKGEGASDLTPNPSPGERGAGEYEGKVAGQNLESSTKGFVNSTPIEWKNTIQFAKQNRKNPTEEEDIMWQALRNRQVNENKFRRQHPIAGYIPDFVCLEKKIIVEIDGGYHNDSEQKIFDDAREEWLKEYGFDMIRFTNDEINKNVNGVLKTIEDKLISIINTENIKALETSSPLPRRGVGGEVSSAPLLRRGGGEVSPSPLERGRGEVKKGVRETSTMPGYAGSSWYFLRYMDPNNTETFCDRKASDYWNQVDVYVGGTEHAVGHLLYSRMWTKVLFDLGYIGFEEPFKKLVNQGMIQGSSRFVYRVNVKIPQSIDPKEFKEDEKLMWQKLPFISKDFYKSFHTDETKKIVKDVLNKIFEGTSLSDCELREPSPIYVDVSMVDGFELNIEAFKKWKNGEFANAEFILEDGSTYSPLSPGEGSGVRSSYICGAEVEKMSKSKYNTVNPDELCEKYGADTFRMYEMFLGPVEQSKPWDTKGIEGVHRFLKKLWRLFYTLPTTLGVETKVLWNNEKPTDAQYKILHKTIKKIEQDTENFSYNTAVAAFMISVNELTDAKCNSKEILSQILILLSPYAPHIAAELWQAMGCEGMILDAEYPKLEEKYLTEATKEYPVSINGKMRTAIVLATEVTEEEAKEAAMATENITKWLEGKEVKKFIFVKGRMINIVV